MRGRRNAIRAAASAAERDLQRWYQAGRYCLETWSGPHARRFADDHRAAAEAWVQLIGRLQDEVATCDRLIDGRGSGWGGAVPIQLSADSDGALSVDADRLRYFAGSAVELGPASWAASVTYDGLGAESVPISTLGEGTALADVIASAPAPVPTEFDVRQVLHLRVPTAEASRLAELITEAAAFAVLVAEAARSADGWGLVDSVMRGSSAREMWATQIAGGHMPTPDQLSRFADGEEFAGLYVAACQARDHDRMQLLESRLDAADDAYLLGFSLMLGDDPKSAFDQLREDGMRPKRHSGVLGTLRDVDAGFLDRLEDGGRSILELSTIPYWDAPTVTPRASKDPVTAPWDRLMSTVASPTKLARSVVDWDTLTDNQARWVGGMVPEVASFAYAGASWNAARAERAAARVAAVDAAVDERLSLGSRLPNPAPESLSDTGTRAFYLEGGTPYPRARG